MDRYLKTLHDELALMSAKAGKAICIDRIHIGGGSPNYLDDVQLAGLMASVHSAFAVTCDAEISMEINPRRTSRSQLDLLQGLGVFDIYTLKSGTSILGCRMNWVGLSRSACWKMYSVLLVI